MADDPPQTLSRNEVEALCLKAARGAGMEWGLAEEAGFAVGWLMARGYDGAAALLALLQTREGQAWADARPHRAANGWVGVKGPLCPIALGTTLSDHAGLADATPVHVGPVMQPVLLLPFLSAVAAQQGSALRLVAGSAPFTIHSSGNLAGDVAGLAARPLTALSLSPDHAAQDIRTTPATMPPLRAITRAGLEAFAHNTTVPASASSRAGAGASGDDD